jgi:hypothetical protein
MLYQIHLVLENGEKETLAQAEFGELGDDYLDWFLAVMQSHPLPCRGTQYLICSEKSEHFRRVHPYEAAQASHT